MRYERVAILVFEVTGRGRFPTDMLRYDCCVPARQEDVSEIERSFNQAPDVEERTIRLRRYAVGDSRPTFERWMSFGWTARQVD